jgi:hypothetical protein
MKLFYEIEFNLINPPPTYHNQKENDRNSDSISPSPTPIFFPRHTQSFSPIGHQLGRRINQVCLEKDDELLVTGERNISPSPDPLPNGTSIKNERKRKRPFNFEFPEGGIYYINLDFFGFPHRSRRCPDNVYFEKYRYLEIPQ